MLQSLITIFQFLDFAEHIRVLLSQPPVLLFYAPQLFVELFNYIQLLVVLLLTIDIIIVLLQTTHLHPKSTGLALLKPSR